MVNATLNRQAQTKLKTQYMSLLSSGKQLEYVYTGLICRGDNSIKKTLVNIPIHMWSYSRRDLHKNGLKWGYNPTTDWMCFWIGAPT